MIYKAIKNFRIDKLVVSVGDVYTGGAIEHLLQKGLIKAEGEKEVNESKDGLIPEASFSPPNLAEKKEKKSKKKAA